ncbi:MAG: molecular chaperone DnaJ [Patescibacteria group bacterium]
MSGKDYYKILGVEKLASPDEVKRAFRKLAHEYHPDKKGGNEAKFKEINEAYQILGDDQKRKQYDQFGAAAFDGTGNFGGGGFGGGGFPGGFNFDFGNAGFEDLGDILGGMFGGGGGGGRARAPRGENIEVGIKLNFREAVFGAEKEIPLTRHSTCARCAGTMAEPGTKMKTCRTCEGKGYRVTMQRTLLGAMQMKTACDDCRGTGEQPEKACSECKGTGVAHGRTVVRVDIPAGVDDGVTVRVRGEGESVGALGEKGDLYLRIRVEPDPVLKREGSTIYVAKNIGFTQAALGDTVDVETVDGKVEVKIPQGTQSGDELRLRGKGVPSSRGRGDQIVIVNVVTPTKIDKKTRELLEEMNLREN